MPFLGGNGRTASQGRGGFALWALPKRETVPAFGLAMRPQPGGGVGDLIRSGPEGAHPLYRIEARPCRGYQLRQGSRSGKSPLIDGFATNRRRPDRRTLAKAAGESLRHAVLPRH